MAKIPIDAMTIASQVQHDLGLWAEDHATVPGLREAQRFAASRVASIHYTGYPVGDIAAQALRDWRAQNRLARLGPGATMESAYRTGGISENCVGARVIVELASSSGPNAGTLGTASILVNINSLETATDAINRAIAGFNSRSVRTAVNYDRGTIATTGSVVQLVEGGWSHAQLSSC